MVMLCWAEVDGVVQLKTDGKHLFDSLKVSQEHKEECAPCIGICTILRLKKRPQI